MSGDGKFPRKKPYKVEHQQRVDVVRVQLLEGKGDGEIKALVAEQFGISPRSVERYLRRAREQMLSETQKSREEWRADNLRKYLAIADDPETEPRDRIRALERVDRLLGLETHPSQRVEISGPDGGPVQQQVAVATVDLGAKLREYADAIKAAAIANVQEQASVLGLPAPEGNGTQR
jgi:hypothetical protein